MQDRTISFVAGLGTAGVIGGFALLLAILAKPTTETYKPIEDKIIIEASLAMSSQDRQPQKDFRPPDKTEAEKISRDEKDPIKPKKDDEKPKKDDKEPPIDINNLPKRPRDDDTPVGPVVKPYDPHGKKTNFDGLDATTKGDPFFGALRRDMNFQPPEIAHGDSVPVGCIELKPDGTIGEIKFENETGDDLQTVAEAALKALKVARNKTPIPVPEHLLSFTSSPLCFKFTVKS